VLAMIYVLENYGIYLAILATVYIATMFMLWSILILILHLKTVLKMSIVIILVAINSVSRCSHYSRVTTIKGLVWKLNQVCERGKAFSVGKRQFFSWPEPYLEELRLYSGTCIIRARKESLEGLALLKEVCNA